MNAPRGQWSGDGYPRRPQPEAGRRRAARKSRAPSSQASAASGCGRTGVTCSRQHRGGVAGVCSTVPVEPQIRLSCRALREKREMCSLRRGRNVILPGQYYDVETGLSYNYRRDYDPATGRYIQSDPIGIRGGMNTYAYVSDNPLRAIDPWGLVEWSGIMSGASVTGGVGASIYRFSLSTPCVNGKKGTAEVIAVGPSFGLQIKAAPPFTTAAGPVTLNDKLDYVDPTVLDGWFSIWSVGVGLGPGYSCSMIKVGGNGMTMASGKAYGAESSPSCGVEFGLDLSAGVTDGSATVVKSSVEDCDCGKK